MSDPFCFIWASRLSGKRATMTLPMQMCIDHSSWEASVGEKEHLCYQGPCAGTQYLIMFARKKARMHSWSMVTHSHHNGCIIPNDWRFHSCVRNDNRGQDLSSPSLPIRLLHFAQQGGKSLLPSGMQIIPKLLYSCTRLKLSGKEKLIWPEQSALPLLCVAFKLRLNLHRTLLASIPIFPN